MKKHLLLFILIFGFSNAQNQRFTYEYRLVPDSTNRENVEKEFMVLDVNPKGSKFYSYEKFKSDSISMADLEKQIQMKSSSINIKTTYKGKIMYTIEKSYPEFAVFLHNQIGRDRYKVSDERNFNWKMSSEKQKIGEFNTQKAETEMYGRKWIAWFTTEIPIQDGPYKFRSLPGLIVKVEDVTKSHIFELKGIKKISTDDQSKLDESRAHNEITINYPTYKKIFLEQRKDPTKAIREMIAQGGATFKMFDKDGKEMNPAEIIRQREQTAKENLKKNNNLLELDLLK